MNKNFCVPQFWVLCIHSRPLLSNILLSAPWVNFSHLWLKITKRKTLEINNLNVFNYTPRSMMRFHVILLHLPQNINNSLSSLFILCIVSYCDYSVVILIIRVINDYLGPASGEMAPKETLWAAGINLREWI